jgi:ketosteroid isomerase-like protein
MTDTEATKIVSDLYHDWAAALTNHQADWFERHIANDFILTAHPFPQLRFGKRKFIEVDMQIQNTTIKFLDIRAHAAGDILVSQAAEINKLLSGRVLAYASAWRRAGDIWQCFDHHLIGPVSF